jgi:tripartite-type tricarboxylate transporter receptor subunit TctC
MDKVSRRQFGFGAAAATLTFGARQAPAQDFPSRAIRILVPYAAGGPSDAAARLIADPLSRQLGQSVYVENRGGAGGLTATEAFFTLPPDGYTILLGAVGPLVIIPAVKQVTYAPLPDLIPLGTIWRSPQLLAVHPKLGISTLAELIQHAKAHPGILSIGSAGIGSLTHLSLELFKREAGVDLIHVPFRSSGGTLPALLGGQIDLMFGDVALLAPYIRAGNVRGLAIAARSRSGLLPDLMTTAEAGLPKVESENWYGLLLSTRTPAPIISRVQSAVEAAQRDPAYLESLNKQGVVAGEPGAQAFTRLLDEEMKKWQPIVSAPGFKID